MVQTHAERHRPDKELAALQRKPKPRVSRPRQPTVGQSVTRKVDVSGSISFAGTAYPAGKPQARRQVTTRSASTVRSPTPAAGAA